VSWRCLVLEIRVTSESRIRAGINYNNVARRIENRLALSLQLDFKCLQSVHKPNGLYGDVAAYSLGAVPCLSRESHIVHSDDRPWST
jgi:hypothetical protein